MTNHLTYTDTTTSKAIRLPTATITSDTDERPPRPSGGRGWIVIAGSAALAVTAAIGFAVTGNDSTEPTEPKAEQRPAYLIVQDEIDMALAERNGASDEQRSASLTVQDEIDAALAEHGSVEVGRALQPGLPDGYWQPVDDTPRAPVPNVR